jgi:hypothetical protein
MHTLRLALLTTLIMTATAPAAMADLRSQIKDAYQDRIKDITSGIACRALSCEVDLERISIVETAPATYKIDATGWLQGTVPGLKGSAKRTVTVTASYTKGTCIIKDVKVLSDETTDNNGWGASRIASALKSPTIQPTFFLKPDDCKKADVLLTTPAAA